MIARQRQTPSVMQPKRHQNVARPTVPGAVGDHHVDARHRRWQMTDHGWELMKAVTIHVLGATKGRWINAARQRHQTLEQFMTEALNDAAAVYQLPAGKVEQ